VFRLADNGYGLSAAVFDRDVARALNVARKIDPAWRNHVTPSSALAADGADQGRTLNSTFLRTVHDGMSPPSHVSRVLTSTAS